VSPRLNLLMPRTPGGIGDKTEALRDCHEAAPQLVWVLEMRAALLHERAWTAVLRHRFCTVTALLIV